MAELVVNTFSPRLTASSNETALGRRLKSKFTRRLSSRLISFLKPGTHCVRNWKSIRKIPRKLSNTVVELH